MAEIVPNWSSNPLDLLLFLIEYRPQQGQDRQQTINCCKETSPRPQFEKVENQYMYNN